jgi:hypothetical protein
MRWDHSGSDAAVATRVRRRIEIACAEIRAIHALPLQPRARTIVAIAEIDLECATTRLNSRPDTLELEHLGRWVEMVESHLRTVRAGVTTGPFELPIAQPVLLLS